MFQRVKHSRSRPSLHPHILSISDFVGEDGLADAVVGISGGRDVVSEACDLPEVDGRLCAPDCQGSFGRSRERRRPSRSEARESLRGDGHVKILDFRLAKRDTNAAPGEETSAPTVPSLGWEAGTRTPIHWSRASCPTIERPPSRPRNGELFSKVLAASNAGRARCAPEAIAVP